MRNLRAEKQPSPQRRLDYHGVIAILEPKGESTCDCPGESLIRCRREHVVDWRYIDAFECVGGAAYRVALRRLPKMTATVLEEKQPFVLEWYERSGDEIIEFDRAFRDLCRDVVNLRYEAVARVFAENKALFSRIGYAPKPDGAIRMRLVKRSVAQQAAAFADGAMMRLLHSWGLLQADLDSAGLLRTAAASGNVETARVLLNLGFAVNVPSRHDATPLDMAIACDHARVVALLLNHGADSNRRDRRGRTSLFVAKSTSVAAMLVDAGADVNACDNDGVSCVRYHLKGGRNDIANLLVARGAYRNPAWPTGLSETQVQRRGVFNLRHFFTRQKPDSLDDFEMMTSIDYGYVLPIERLRILK